MIIKWVSRPNREKYAYKHTCPFILVPYFVTYPLNSLLIFLEQFCHPHPNELDHCAQVFVTERGLTCFFQAEDSRNELVYCLLHKKILRTTASSNRLKKTRKIDIIQEKCSGRFTLSNHVHSAQMETVNPNLAVQSPRTISKVAYSKFFFTHR